CVDTVTDPDNCGACGVPCASGICQNGTCVGSPVGHIVIIGHDYTTTRTGMNRLLGNAVFLARGAEAKVASYATGALPVGATGANGAIGRVAREIGRTWRTLPLDASTIAAGLSPADVLLVYAEGSVATDDLVALASSWETQLAYFLGRGGIVVVLE